MRGMFGQQDVGRRTVLIALVNAATVAALSFHRTKADEKVSQKAVQYQLTPKRGQACAGCNSFIAPNQCKRVAGEISPTGWCSLWTKKEG